jgi:uncharacterized protein
MRILHITTLIFTAFLPFSCKNAQQSPAFENAVNGLYHVDTISIPPKALAIANAAVSLTQQKVVYDPAYFAIPYPNGDVPADKGVCTDVVIRTYRKLGIDLQQKVHEDMTKHFNLYPKIWGLKKTDTNIDHRRVPNLQVYFKRFGTVKTISDAPSQFQAGDIVTWDLGRGLTHIGIVSNRKSSDGKRYLIVHNIGNGQELSDCLFSYTMTGHYAYE